jgi:hypothetical protein
MCGLADYWQTPIRHQGIVARGTDSMGSSKKCRQRGYAALARESCGIPFEFTAAVALSKMTRLPTQFVEARFEQIR